MASATEGHIYEQTNQDMSVLNNSIKNNPHTSKIPKQEINYFIADPFTETDRRVSTETTLKMHDEFSDRITGIEYSKALSPYRSKMVQSHTRHPQGA